jgi:hypothetical protein
MGDGTRRDADIEQHKKIAQPDSLAYGSRVLDGLAERVEVMRLFGEFFGSASRWNACCSNPTW